IAIAALIGAQENPQLIEVVKASITGSIIGNILFVLGLSIFMGGWKRNHQTFNKTGTGAASTFMTLTAIGLIIPAAFALTLDAPTTAAQVATQRNLLENLSLGVAGILILS